MCTRRDFFRRSVAMSSAAIGWASLAGACNGGAVNQTPAAGKGKDTSNSNSKGSDTSAKAGAAAGDENDLKKRKQLGYVDKTPIPESHCSNCGLYIAPKQGQKEGGCQLFKGPVNENGYCTYWVAAV